MSDLEMTRLCAEAMELRVIGEVGIAPHYGLLIHGEEVPYQPLYNDAQAMALVKKFVVQFDKVADGYRVRCEWGEVTNPDLNRAVVECGAMMQKAKQ